MDAMKIDMPGEKQANKKRFRLPPSTVCRIISYSDGRLDISRGTRSRVLEVTESWIFLLSRHSSSEIYLHRMKLSEPPNFTAGIDLVEYPKHIIFIYRR